MSPLLDKVASSRVHALPVRQKCLEGVCQSHPKFGYLKNGIVLRAWDIIIFRGTCGSVLRYSSVASTGTREEREREGRCSLMSTRFNIRI